MPGPHAWGHERSLGRAFAPRPRTLKGLVRPAFALALYGGVLYRLSRPLGSRVIFSRECRPSRTAHLTLSPHTGVSPPSTHGWCFTFGSPTPGGVGSTPPTYSTHECPEDNARLR